MKEDNEKRLRKIREREKDIHLAQRRREKRAAREIEEIFFDGGLTDKRFAYPAQKEKKNFVNSANGNQARNDV